MHILIGYDQYLRQNVTSSNTLTLFEKLREKIKPVLASKISRSYSVSKGYKSPEGTLKFKIRNSTSRLTSVSLRQQTVLTKDQLCMLLPKNKCYIISDVMVKFT